MAHNPLTIYHPAAVVRWDGRTFRPGALVLGDDQLVWLGPAEQIPAELVHHGHHVDVGQYLLLPGMVNAHTHLDLTDVGPRAYPGNFIRWMVMLGGHWLGQSQQAASDEEQAEAQAQAFAAAARGGAQASLNSGVTAVGDISRFARVAQARRQAGLDGITFEEMFGIGSPWDEPGLNAIRSEPGTTQAEGVQPHAPYSAGPRLYEAASKSARPVSTHLAEMPEELRFIHQADGPWLRFLQSIGKWDQAFAAHYGQGLSPVQWMEPFLEQAAERNRPWLLAHCNYVTDEDIQILARTHTSVAYCPRASAYFHHPQPEAGAAYQPPGGQVHRYQDMLDAGVNVCLGTDSIVCQPSDEPQPMSIVAQMRMLHQRDHLDPAVLFRLATINGQRALGLANPVPTFYQIRINPADPTDPLTQALQNHEPIEPTSQFQSPPAWS